MTSWDKFCIPQIALRWYKIHLPSSSSQWQSPWDAWSHRDNQEAACQNRIWTSNSGVSSKSKIYQLTGRKIDTPLLDQQGPQTHHKCPSCHHPHPHNSPKSETQLTKITAYICFCIRIHISKGKECTTKYNYSIHFAWKHKISFDCLIMEVTQPNQQT